MLVKTTLLLEIYFKVHKYRKNTKVIHIKDCDRIWKYEDYFKKSNWNNNDYHFSGNKNKYIVWNNSIAKTTSFIICKSVNLNINKNDFDQNGAMIIVKKWNQMMIDFDENSKECKSEEIVGKYLIAKKGKVEETWMFIDYDCIQNVYTKEDDEIQLFNFTNFKYLKIDKYISKEISNLLDYIQSVKLNPFMIFKIDVKFAISSETSGINLTNNFEAFKNWIFQNLHINLDGELNEEIIISIMSSISKIKRIDHLYINVYSPSLLYILLSNISKIDSRTKLSVKYNFPLDPYEKLTMKSILKRKKIHTIV